MNFLIIKFHRISSYPPPPSSSALYSRTPVANVLTAMNIKFTLHNFSTTKFHTYINTQNYGVVKFSLYVLRGKTER